MPSDHPDDGQLALYLDGQLSWHERRAVDVHLDACAACRETLSVAAEVLGATRATTQEPAVHALVPAPRRARRWAGVALAAAASIAVISVSRTGPRSRSHDLPTDRIERERGGASGDLNGEGIARIDAVSPANDEAVPASQSRFVWASSGAAHYTFALLSADGAPVWSTETTDTVLTLPPNIALLPGATYFWYVKATAGGTTASMRMRRIRVVP